MTCEHQKSLGSPCQQCPGGVAVAALRKRKRSISPVRPAVAPPPPIIFVPVSQSAAVGSLHSALAANAADSANSAHADPINSTVPVVVLNAIMQALPIPNPKITLTTSACNMFAVCWNWVFAGGINATAEDPNWAFLYVTKKGEYPIPTENEQIENKLDAAVAKLHGTERYTKAVEESIYKDILHALMLHYGLEIQENSALKVLFYYDPSKVKSRVMYRHFEFEYNDITITKGLGEELKAFNGKSALEGFPKPLKISVAINPNSLSKTHISVLRSLIAQMQPAQHIGKKKKQGDA